MRIDHLVELGNAIEVELDVGEVDVLSAQQHGQTPDHVADSCGWWVARPAPRHRRDPHPRQATFAPLDGSPAHRGVERRVTHDQDGTTPHRQFPSCGRHPPGHRALDASAATGADASLALMRVLVTGATGYVGGRLV